MKDIIKKWEKQWGERHVMLGFIAFFLILIGVGCLAYVNSSRGPAFTVSYPAVADMEIYHSSNLIMPMSPMPRRIAMLQVTATDKDALLSQIANTAYHNGGFITQAQFDGHKMNGRGSIVFHVDAMLLDEALDQVKSSVETIRTESVSTNEADMQLAALAEEIESLEIARTAYESLLADADTFEESLHINSALLSINREVSTLEFRYMQLENAQSRAEIHVNFEVPEKIGASINWKEKIEMGSKSLVYDLEKIAAVLLLCVFALPALLFKLALLGIVLYVIYAIVVWLKEHVIDGKRK